MKKIFLFLSIIIFINSSVNYGQAVTRDQSGILLRFNMNQPDICDTIGNWHMRHSFYILNNDIISSSERHYLGIINLSNRAYLLDYTRQSIIDKETYDSCTFALVNIETGIRKIYASKNEQLNVFHLSTNKVRVPNGWWLFNRSIGNVFLSNEDSLFIFPSYKESTDSLELTDILIKIGDKYISSFYRKATDNFCLYKINLDQSPILDPASFEHIEIESEMMIDKIVQVDSALFLISRPGEKLQLYELSNNKLIFRKYYSIGPFPGKPHSWSLKNDKIFYIGGSGLSIFKFNKQDSSIAELNHIYDDLTIPNAFFCCFDENFTNAYYTIYDDDSSLLYLKPFNIDSETWGETIKLGRTNWPVYNSFIDSSFFFFHQAVIDTMFQWNPISFNQDDMDNLTYKLSAYPNPFNPQTTIAFTIPNAGKVELAVYDLLGRKVTELLNEYRDKGSYEIKFNGANLASGIYFYTIKTGNFVKTEKLMLLK